MQRQVALSAVTVAVLLCSVLAESPEPGTFTGLIAVQDKAPVLKAGDNQVYKLANDPRSQSLGVMRGQKVEVRGTVAEVNGGKVLTVSSYAASEMTDAHELWRHMRCNACVVLPATVNSAEPKDLQGAKAVAGRYYGLKEQFRAWTRNDYWPAGDHSIWAASDTRLFRINPAADDGKIVREFGVADGLPDTLIYQLASDGTTLFIVHRGGLARLNIADGKIVDDAGLRFAFGQVLVDRKSAWLIADTGTFRLSGGKAEKLPALPTAGRFAKIVDGGVWVPHWQRRTDFLISNPQAIGDRLYVTSYGDLYELADGAWKKLADGGHSARVWQTKGIDPVLVFLSLKGLNCYDPKAGQTTVHEPPENCRGRYAQLALTADGILVAADPVAKAGKDPSGGGLSKFDMKSKEWADLSTVAGHSTANVACMFSEKWAPDAGTWVVTVEGKYATRAVHPGMTYVERKVLQPTGLVLLRCGYADGKWEAMTLDLPDLERRLICGQDGESRHDVISPQGILSLSVGQTRVFAATRLVPKAFFGGYWPCVNQVASRPLAGGDWKPGFEHHPEQLDLQGDFPKILNISNGELIAANSMLKDVSFEAVGHDNVLGLFDDGGRHWAVTEGCVAVFDEKAGQWHKVVELANRWYWRATAVLDEGQFVYIGSDRGLLTRLDTKTGRFEPQVVLNDRNIRRIGRDAKGRLVVVAEPAPLGAMPVQLAKLKAMDCDAVCLDGGKWVAASAGDLPARPGGDEWTFKPVKRGGGHLDKSQGNYAFIGKADKPSYYVKEVFFPRYLAGNAEARRVWLSSYTGLIRVDGIGQ